MGVKVQGADMRDHNRVPLRDIVPLDRPLSMYIDPSNLCNIRCKFCPTSDHRLLKQVGRPSGWMRENTFRLLLDQLDELGRIKTINFFKDGEPLVHPAFPEMAAELRKRCDRLYLRTNGLLLTPEKNTRIARAGFDNIGISVIAPHRGGYHRISGVELDYFTFRSHVRDLYEKRGKTKLYIKMADVDFSESEVEQFYTDFEPICDFIAVENLHGWSRTDLKDFTLGHQDNTSFDGVPNVKRVACAWPLFQMTVNWNGTVQPCDEDWSWVNVMGDIHDNTLKEIWTGDKFNEFRRMHLRGERFGNKACGNCWQTMSQLDDVDPYREELLERMGK